MTNKITTLVEFQTDNAKSGLKNLVSAVDDAEGGFGKLKAGVGSLGDSLGKAMSGPGGIVLAGGAIASAGAAAFSAVSDFSSLGVEVGKFGDATGLTVDQASRWIEISGDIGIPADNLESAIGKMNKTAGNTPEKFTNAGVAIATTKDGAVDANQTFLNTIDVLNGIKDPAKRAALGAQLLGKGWQSVAELVGQGSDKIVQSLAAVENQKVFDDSKVQKARNFRAAMDNLHDSVEDLVLTIGTQLEPVIEKIVNVAAKATTAYIGSGTAMRANVDAMMAMKDEADKAGINWFKLNNAVVDGKVTLEEATQQIHDATRALDDHTAAGSETDRETRNLTRSTGELTASEEDVAASADDAAKKSKAYADEIKNLTDKTNELYGKEYNAVQAHLDYQKASVDTMTAVANLSTVLHDHKSTTDDVTSATNNARDAMIDAAKKYATMDGAAEDSEGAIRRQIQSLEAQEQSLAPDSPLRAYLDQYIAALKNIPSSVSTALDLHISSGSATTKDGDVIGKLKGARAGGGPVSAGGDYLVGEKGPEVVHMGGNGTVIPNGALGGITNNFYGITDPRELARQQAREIGWALRST